MANLKGSSFDKQIKNALCRLGAVGQSRHGREDNMTHSVALGKKREMYLHDFKEHLQSQGIADGKMNEHMTAEAVKSFLEERTADLAPKTSLDYSSGFNSMLQGLESTNVSISPAVHDTIADLTTTFREQHNETKQDFDTNRSIADKENFINDLKELRPGSSLVAELQLEIGLRAKEALEVAANIDKYYNPVKGSLSDIVGKGGQSYPDKDISDNLAQRIAEYPKFPSYSTYQADIRELSHTSHDLRITYAKETYENLKTTHGHQEALKMVSEELNHHRESITTYYLARA